MTGIPCCHGISAISFLDEEGEDYIDNYYTKETYPKTYSESIPAIVSEKAWPRVDLKIAPLLSRLGQGGQERIERKNLMKILTNLENSQSMEW